MAKEEKTTWKSMVGNRYTIRKDEGELLQIEKDLAAYIMCFVHFNHSTKEREGIYFSVWDFSGLLDSPIIVELSENETEMLYNYALEKIKGRKEK